MYNILLSTVGFKGAVLANRLSEISHWRILIIEAGENENSISDVPKIPGANGAKMDWGYKLEPQYNSFFGEFKL